MTDTKIDITAQMNKVDVILSRMIAAWPSLYPTRWAALKHITSQGASQYYQTWTENGCPIVEQHSLHNDGDRRNKSQDETVGKEADRLEKAISKGRRDGYEGIDWGVRDYSKAYLRQQRELVENAFIVEHADYIAMSRPHRLGKLYSRDFSRLAQLPLNVDAEWLAAFVELAEQAQYEKFDEAAHADMAPDYRDRCRDEHALAQKDARDFLTRLKGNDVEKKALAVETFQDRMAKLIAEAAQQGVTINATVE